MAQSSWPFPDPSNSNKRVVDDAQYEWLASALNADGLIGDPTMPSLMYADGTGLHFKVRAGRYAKLRGHIWYSGPDTITVPVTANTSGSTRKDLGVLRLDRSTWEVTAAAVAGTPGGPAPQPVTSTASTGVFELPLGEATVINGAVTLSEAQVVPRAWYVGEPLIVCTSTTRPAHRPGRRIWETDDDGRELISDGSTWRVTLDKYGYTFGQSGQHSVSFSARSSQTLIFPFSKPFSSTPKVYTNIASSASMTAQWHSRAYNISPTGFTMFLFGPSAAWSNIPVQWWATP